MDWDMVPPVQVLNVFLVLSSVAMGGVRNHLGLGINERCIKDIVELNGCAKTSFGRSLGGWFV